MPERVKYPLTPEAKEAARQLVQAWDEGKLARIFEVHIESEPPIVVDENLHELPAKGELYELEYYGLIQIRVRRGMLKKYMSFGTGSGTYTDYEQITELLLLQELRNAVNTSFEVSDYFLTLNAVGTIVYGNLEVKEGAIFQSAAAGQGSIVQNTGQLLTELENLLGDETLKQNPQLQAALNSLSEINDKTDQRTLYQKTGSIIQELGRCLDHVNNTGGTIAALALLTKALGG